MPSRTLRPAFSGHRRTRCAITLLALLAAVVSTFSVGRSERASAAGPPSPPTLSWQACGHAAQCTSIQVPLDWDHPHGAKITLAFAIHRATDPAGRVGTLILSPGHGVSGMQYVADRVGAYGFDRRLTEQFDVVGIDQRGGGAHPSNTPIPLPVRSTALKCDTTAHADGSLYFPTTRAGYDQLVAHNRSFALGCLADTGALVRHMDSLSKARDVEAVREALGEDRISWFSWTSGDHVGLTYLSEYPNHVRTIAFDQPSDRSMPMRPYTKSYAAGVQDEFDRFVAWCDAATKCVLHGHDVRREFRDLLAAANRNPVPSALGFSMTGDELQMLTEEMLQLGDLVIQPPDLTGFDGVAIAMEQILDPADPRLAGLPPVFDTMYVNTIGWTGDWEQYRVVSCNDFATGVNNYQSFERLSRQLARIAPDMQGATQAWETISGCAGWPFPPANPQHPLRFSRNTPAALIMASRHSAWAPYEQAQQVHRQIPNSGLITYEGDAHINYLSSRVCMVGHLEDYLITGALPAPGTTCAQEGPLAGQIP